MDIREKIARIVRRDVCDTYADMAENILALLKEEGWKSPEEVREVWWMGYDIEKETK